MKHTVISILIILSAITSVYATNFDFSFNNINNINEEISVVIENKNLNGLYDVKAYIHNSSDDKISRAEITSNTLNQGYWMDSWNYIDSAFPENNIFQLKLQDYSENNSICVKLRKTNSSEIYEICKRINFQLENSISLKNSKSNNNVYSTNLNLFRLIIVISSFILVLIILIILSLEL